jgi:hypothetical protein
MRNMKIFFATLQIMYQITDSSILLNVRAARTAANQINREPEQLNKRALNQRLMDDRTAQRASETNRGTVCNSTGAVDIKQSLENLDGMVFGM